MDPDLAEENDLETRRTFRTLEEALEYGPLNVTILIKKRRQDAGLVRGLLTNLADVELLYLDDLGFLQGM